MNDIREKTMIRHGSASEQLHLLRTVFDNAAEGMIICTRDDRIIWVNRAFSKITAYEAEEALGRTLDILLSNRQPAASYFEIYTAVREQGHWRGELWSRRKNGESYVQSRSVTAVRDEAGKTTHLIIIFSDTAKQKRDEDKPACPAAEDVLAGTF